MTVLSDEGLVAADRLDQIEARANAATEGPWHRYGTWPYEIYAPREPDGGPYIASVTGDDGRNESNAEFIARVRADVPALVAALRAVLRVCDATEATPVPGIVITGAHVSTTNIRRAIEEALT